MVDTESDDILRMVPMEAHTMAAHVTRQSADGRYLVVTGYDPALQTIFNANPQTPTLLQLAQATDGHGLSHRRPEPADRKARRRQPGSGRRETGGDAAHCRGRC